ncbi:MAG: isoamylase early set domain-containing protein [Pseudomonadota bacterium]
MATSPSSVGRLAMSLKKKYLYTRGVFAMSLAKKYLKTRPVCKATFTMPAEELDGVEAVELIGDFNGWEAGTLPMKRKKDGSWSLEIELEPGREYQFLYRLGEETYANDDAADAYAPNPFGTGENSIIRV